MTTLCELPLCELLISTPFHSKINASDFRIFFIIGILPEFQYLYQLNFAIKNAKISGTDFLLEHLSQRLDASAFVRWAQAHNPGTLGSRRAHMHPYSISLKTSYDQEAQ